MRRHAMTCCLMLAALLGSPPARAQPDAARTTNEMKPDARAHLTEGLRLYESGAYAEAITAFQRGWEIDPQPDFLYALGQAERKRGDCKKAIEHYAAFLLRVRTDAQVAAARLQIQRCDEELTRRARAGDAPAAAPPPAPAASPSTAKAQPAPAPAQSSDVGSGDQAPWYSDVPGGLLVGTGAAATIVGAALFLQANATIADAGDSYDAYGSASEAEPRRLAGAIVGGAGVALITAGIVRYVVVASAAPDRSTVAAAVGPRGAAVVWSARF